MRRSPLQSEAAAHRPSVTFCPRHLVGSDAAADAFAALCETMRPLKVTTARSCLNSLHKRTSHFKKIALPTTDQVHATCGMVDAD